MLFFYRHTPVGQEYGIDESIQLTRWLVDAGIDGLDLSPARDERVADLTTTIRYYAAVTGKDLQNPIKLLESGPA